jgi:hypothetical protein
MIHERNNKRGRRSLMILSLNAALLIGVALILPLTTVKAAAVPTTISRQDRNGALCVASAFAQGRATPSYQSVSKDASECPNHEAARLRNYVNVQNLISAIDERVVAQLERAWRAAGAGMENRESVVLLFRMVDGSIEARGQGLTNEQLGFTFRWHPEAVAIVHTHPNSVNPRPSENDRRIADKMAVPIFTITSRGMFVYDPEMKTISQLQASLNWLELSKWTHGPNQNNSLARLR